MKHPSLRKYLNDEIQKRGYIARYEVMELARKFGYVTRGLPYRESNAERRLRKSESPLVDEVTDNGAIVAYKWIGESYVAPVVERKEMTKEEMIMLSQR